MLAYLEQQYHGLSESLEIIDIVQATMIFNVHEKGHAKYGKNEHYQEQQ